MNLGYDHITREIERVRHRRRLLAAEDDFLPSTRTGFRQLQEKLAIDAAASRERNSQLLQQLRQVSQLDINRRTTAADVQLYALRGAYLALVHESFPEWYRTASKHIHTQVQLHQQQQKSTTDPNSFIRQQQPYNSSVTNNQQSYQQQQACLPACAQAKPSIATTAAGNSNSTNLDHKQYDTSYQDVNTQQIASAAKASVPGPASAQDIAPQANSVGALPPAALEQLTNSMAEQLVLLQQLVRAQHYPQLQQQHHQQEQQEQQLARGLQTCSKPVAAPMQDIQQQILPVETIQHGQEQKDVVDFHQQRMLNNGLQEQPLQQQQQQQSKQDSLQLHRVQSEFMQQQQQVVAHQPAQQDDGWQSKIPIGRQARLQDTQQQLPQEPNSIHKQQHEHQHVTQLQQETPQEHAPLMAPGSAQQEQPQCELATQQSALHHEQELGANTVQQETRIGTHQQQQQVGEQHLPVIQQKGPPAQQLLQQAEDQGQSQTSHTPHMSPAATVSQQWQTGTQAVPQASAADQYEITTKQLNTLTADPLIPHKQVAAGSYTSAANKGLSHSSTADQVIQQHAGSWDVLAAQQQALVVAEPAQQRLRAAGRPVAGSADHAAAAAVADPTLAAEQQQTMPGFLRMRINSMQQQQMPETPVGSTDTYCQRSSNSGMHLAAAEQLLSLVDNMLAQQRSHTSGNDSSEAPSVESLAESMLDDDNMQAFGETPADTATITLVQKDFASSGQGLLADRSQQVLPARLYHAGRDGVNLAGSIAVDATAVVSLSARLGVGDKGVLISSSAGTGTAAASGGQLTDKQHKTVCQSQLENTTAATAAAPGATAALRVGPVSQLAAAAGPKAPPPPPPLPPGGFLPPNSMVDHSAASTASVGYSSPTGKHVGSAVAAALAQLQHTSSDTRQVSGQLAAGLTALDNSAATRRNPQGFGISSLAVNLDSKAAAAAAAAPVDSNPGLGSNVSTHRESSAAANAPQPQFLGIRSYQRAPSINYTQPVTSGPLLSPATRLSLGAVGNDAALSSGRPSLSSESDMCSVYSFQGSNKRLSLGAAGSGVLNVLNPKVQPPLRIPENAVVPGSRRGSVGAAPSSSGIGPGAEGERGTRDGNPVPGLQLGGVGPGSTVDEAPPLHRRERQQQQQHKLALGSVAVQAHHVFGRQGSGTGTNSAVRLVSKVLNTGLTDFGGSDSDDAEDEAGGVDTSFNGNRAKAAGAGNTSSHNTLVAGGVVRESRVSQVGIRNSAVVCAGDDEFDF